MAEQLYRFALDCTAVSNKVVSECMYVTQEPKSIVKMFIQS